MRSVIVVVAVAVLSASCAAPLASEAPPAAKMAALVSNIEVTGNPAKMPDEERVRLEASVARVLAAGGRIIPALLDEISRAHDVNRRLVLVKTLYIIIDLPHSDDATRAGYYKRILAASEKLLASARGSDRYTGALLAALPRKSRIVPVAISMLEDPDKANREFAAALLKGIVPADRGFRADGSPAERAAAVKRWKKWWRRNHDREFYYAPMANPILRSLRAETARIARSAGPYPLEIVDGKGSGVPGVIVTYSYYFNTPDGIGKNLKHQDVTDSQGKVLLALEKVPSGTKFMGAQIIISKVGYGKRSLRIMPHFLTPNSFGLRVTLEKTP